MIRFINKSFSFLLSLLKYIPYSIINLLSAGKAIPTKEKYILIIKLDEIGDYLLFRSLIKYVRTSQKFKGYKVILCGNDAWKELSELLDKDFVDVFFWINKKKFFINLLYRYKILKAISRLYTYHVVNFSHSRNLYLDDSIVKVSNSPFKYGDKSDLSNLFLWQKNISDHYYTHLIDTTEKRFEFYKNILFFNELAETEINLNGPFLEEITYVPKISTLKEYIIIAPGARFRHKRWKAENFAKVGNELSTKFKIIVTGSKAEKKYTELLEKKFDNFLDLTGKTSLIDLINLVKNSKLVITNDSGIVHLAAVLKIKSVVLHNGTHYGRFIPYPEEMEIPQIIIHPSAIHKLSKLERERLFFYRSYLDINTIEVSEVLNSINKILGMKLTS